MKILFLSHHFYPHVGGVEKHVQLLAKELAKKGHKITILTEKYVVDLKSREIVDGIKVERFSYPKIKLIGLFSIWFWLFKNRDLIEKNNIIHIHDVFIWYLPFRFLYPRKPVYTIIHGLEWDNLLSKRSIFQKRLAVMLSKGTIGVGKYLEKYLGVNFSEITYGAATPIKNVDAKEKGRVVYVGRLDENTGLEKFLKTLDKKRRNKIDFCGEGRLRSKCEKYGTVHGFTNPTPFYKKAEICVPGGYLAALEGLSYGCRLKLFWADRVKRDSWKMSPFIKKNASVWVKKQTWQNMAKLYERLWKI